MFSSTIVEAEKGRGERMPGELEREPTSGDAPVGRSRPSFGPSRSAGFSGARAATGSLGSMLSAADTATRAALLLQLQRTHGNAYVQRLAAATPSRLIQRSGEVPPPGVPIVSPENPMMPEGMEQEYWVTEELKKKLAQIADGELTAAEAAGGATVEAEAVTAAGALVGLAAAFGILATAAVVLTPAIATLSEGATERRVGDQIVAATDGYVAGFMNGIGWSMSGGDPAWFADAKAKGAAAKAAMVAKVKADPRLKHFAIGPDEVMLVIASRREAFHKALYAQVKPQIASLYISRWKESLGRIEKFFNPNIEQTGERNIRTRAGLSDRGPLPEPNVGAPPGS
jgi:hypothetical protein